MVVSCVSGPPMISASQWDKVDKIKVYKKGELPTKKYTELNEISAADCSGAPAGGRVWGRADQAIKTLKIKAVSQNANAVINTVCSPVPLVNNCWAAMKCDGLAVKWEN
jgi:hypothetical protein